MDFNYQILFTIELMHEYFMDGEAHDIEVIPSADTNLAFKNIDIQWRNIDNKFFALIRENDQHEPFINKPPAKIYREFFGHTIFRLYLKLKNVSFLDYTNIAVDDKQGLYFSNLAENKIVKPAPEPPSLYLSQRISDHAIGREYLPGNFVMKPATDLVFETLQKHTSTAVAQLNDPALWLPRQTRQFPTANEQIVFTGAIYTFMLPADVTDATAQLFGFNFDDAAPDFNVPVGEAATQHFNQPTHEVKVDLNGFLPGRYKLQVNAETIFIYYDPLLKIENIVGVVEIFNHLPGTDDYAFLDANETIQLKQYTIQFPTRNVLWKYVRKDNTAQTITDTGVTNYAFNLNGNEFVSTVPIPLSEASFNTLKLDFSTTDHALFPLPNPRTNGLGRYHQNGFDYSSAEVFLNY